MSRTIPLTQGQVAIVDDELFNWLNQWKWSIDGSGYPQRMTKTNKGWRPRRMHRDILNLIGRQMADHINNNKLNNCLCNLRQCDASGNVRSRGLNKNNSTGYKGVYYNKTRCIFQAYITVAYKHMYLGAFNSKIDAARAYDRAAVKYFGEFAHTNFPKENYDV